jgi:molybdate-binding protein
VALGAADAGVATRDAALAYGLHFVPLAEERYDLVIPVVLLTDVRVQRLLDTLSAAPCRQELAALGYDVSACGQRVAELAAA